MFILPTFCQSKPAANLFRYFTSLTWAVYITVCMSLIDKHSYNASSRLCFFPRKETRARLERREIREIWGRMGDQDFQVSATSISLLLLLLFLLFVQCTHSVYPLTVVFTHCSIQLTKNDISTIQDASILMPTIPYKVHTNLVSSQTTNKASVLAVTRDPFV